jgi:AcrR family transcriptional regulator
VPPPRRKAPRSPRWQRRPALRPEAILRAALASFGEQGYAGARMADVARRAGLSKAALYRYFPSKQALFEAMVRAEAHTALDQESLRAGFFPDTAEKQLRRFLRESWAALRQPELRTITRLVHAEAGRFPGLARRYFEEVIGRMRTRLGSVLAAGRARGEFRPLPHDLALHALPSLLVHQAMLRDPAWSGLDPLALPDEALLTGTLDLLLHGLLRRGTRTAAE